jgi:hypothetical protein
MPRRFLVAVLALPACSGSDGLTARDVYAIVDEVDVAVRAEALVEPVVLIASESGMNASSPEGAASALEKLLVQIPCVDVVRSTSTLSIVYSASMYTCGYGGTYGGQLGLSGEQTITFLQADGTHTSIDHTWKGVTNGYLTVDGTAHVTTDSTVFATSQRVVNALSWVRKSDGKSGHGKDDRTSPMTSSLGHDPPPPTGLRTWESDAGSWEMRPIDARVQGSNDGIPFVGTYAIVTPARQALTLSITYGANGPELILTDGNHSYSFGLTPGGTPTE